MRIIKRRDGTIFGGYTSTGLAGLHLDARWVQPHTNAKIMVYSGNDIDLDVCIQQLTRMRYDVHPVTLVEQAPPGPNALAQARITCARELYAKQCVAANLPAPVPFEELADVAKDYWLHLADLDTIMRGTD